MRKIPVLLVATFTLSCLSRAPETPAPETRPAHPVVIRGTRTIPPAWTLRSRPATAKHAMVVTAHPLATQAGVELLEHRRHTIDAPGPGVVVPRRVLPHAAHHGGPGVHAGPNA